MELLRAYLADRDAACPRCGYNLRGLTDAACPECGWEVSLERLREVEEHRAWRESRMPRDPITTAGLLGSLVGLGWPLAWLLLGVVAKMVEFTRGHLVVLAVVLLVQVGMVAIYLRGVVRMKSWPRRRKAAMAILAWCWGPAMLAAILVWTVVREAMFAGD